MLNLRRLCEVAARGQHFLIKISSERGEMLKKRAIASVRRATRLHSMSSQVDIPVHFFTNEAESNNNRLKAKKGRQSSGFTGTIEAVESIAKEEEEEFA